MYTKRNYGVLPRSLGGLMEDVFQNGWNRVNEEVLTFSAPVNIYETEKTIELNIVAPGLKKEDFRINIDRGILNLTYEHSDEKNEKEEGKWLRNEYRFKSFKRSFTMNENIDATQISAKYNNGILVVTLPKREKVSQETNEIQVS